MSKYDGFVWEGIINDPERQEAVAAGITAENRRRAEKEDKLCQFHRDNAQRKKTRVEIQACKYLMGALTAGVAAYFAGYGGIGWLAWVLGSIAAVMAGIAIYGLGRVKEMGKAIEKAASRCARPESGVKQGNDCQVAPEIATPVCGLVRNDMGEDSLAPNVTEI